MNGTIISEVKMNKIKTLQKIQRIETEIICFGSVQNLNTNKEN